MANPAQDFVGFLDGQFGLTKASNLFVGAIRTAPEANVPTNSVFVRSAGGTTPIRSMGDKTQLRQALLDIRVRNDKVQPARDLAQNILDSIDKLAVPTGYLDAETIQSAPVDNGFDDSGNSVFSLTVRLKWSHTAA